MYRYFISDNFGLKMQIIWITSGFFLFHAFITRQIGSKSYTFICKQWRHCVLSRSIIKNDVCIKRGSGGGRLFLQVSEILICNSDKNLVKFHLKNKIKRNEALYTYSMVMKAMIRKNGTQFIQKWTKNLHIKHCIILMSKVFIPAIARDII